MSVFLGILAARIRPAAPPIEPRRVSLFESPVPAPPSGKQAVEKAGEKFTAPAASLPGTQSFAATETLRPPTLQFQPSPASLPGPPSPQITLPDVLPVTKPTREPTLDLVREVAADRPITRPAPETVSAAIPEVLPTASAPSQNALSYPVIIERIISATTPCPSTPESDDSRPALPAPPAEPLLALPTVRLIEPAVTASALPAPGPASDGIPAIHVSIGRVEVRAVVPPSVPPPLKSPTRKPDPIIPLDDYLKKQGSRGARA